MNNLQKQRDEGFTIIEVVLVLAIGALIMLMVFIALPALQRNQRDNARKNDVSRLQSEINNYKSRNRGSLPSSAVQWQNRIVGNSDDKTGMHTNGDTFADPSGDDYTVSLPAPGAATQPPAFSDSNKSIIYLYPGASCNGENVTGTVSLTSRKVAIVKPLEGGGWHCQEA